MQLFESSFPMSRNELLYVSCLKEAQSSTNFDISCMNLSVYS